MQVRLGVAIKAQRMRLGVTQEELAWRAEMHRTYLADIERGGRNVTLKSIANLARALEVSIQHLLDESVGMEPRELKISGLVEILLVEDNPQDAELTLLAFRRAKFTNPIKVVNHGREAFDYLNCTGRYAKRQTTMPQLVLLDLGLPDMTGLEVLRAIRSSKHTRNIPVVILTGSRLDKNILATSRLGAAHYIIKPMNIEAFSRSTQKFDLHWALVNPYTR